MYVDIIFANHIHIYMYSYMYSFTQVLYPLNQD